MKKISPESVVSQIEDIIASDIDDEKVMMSVEMGQYFGLNPVGSRVWELIEKPVKVSILIKALLLKYEVEHEICEQETLSFLEELHESGILRIDA